MTIFLVFTALTSSPVSLIAITYIDTYLHFTDPIPAIRQLNMEQIMTTQQTTHTDKLKTLYRVSQEECARLREGVPYVKVYRYNPKHLYPKLNGYGDYGQRKVGASCGSKYCNLHS